MKGLNYRVNEHIKAPRVQVIGPDGENLGIMSIKEALKLAEEYDLDLVEVAPNASPPVTRIMDYGKFIYQQKKGKDRSKAPQLREIEMTPNIGEHDLQVKIRKIKELLEKDNKVKVSIRMRGRQRLHSGMAEELARKIIMILEDVATVEREPVVETSQVFFIVKPRK